MHLTYDPILDELRGDRPRTFTLGPLELDADSYARGIGALASDGDAEDALEARHAVYGETPPPPAPPAGPGPAPAPTPTPAPTDPSPPDLPPPPAPAGP